MSEITKNSANFIGYEYKDISVKHKMEPIYADGYPNFGWLLEGTSFGIQNIGSITMKFKRDCKLRNKAELSRLQRQFDSCVGEIEKLEFSKTVTASVTAYVIGILGSAFMAGSVFAFTAGQTPLFIILAIPGLLGWIIPYFAYVNLRRKKTEKVTPLIDQKYDEIYEVCEKANGLLD